MYSNTLGSLLPDAASDGSKAGSQTSQFTHKSFTAGWKREKRNRRVAEGSEASQCLSVQVETGPVCEFKYLRIIIKIWLRAGDLWVREVSSSISCSYRL